MTVQELDLWITPKSTIGATMSPEIQQWTSLIKKSRRGSASGKRHPHQPAVLLWFINEVSSGNSRMVAWSDGKGKWAQAIKARNGNGAPESPITALVNGGILECSIELSKSASSPTARRVLTQSNPSIGLPEFIWSVIRSDSATKDDLVKFINSQFD
jgi:hypothetical protein